MEGNRSYLPASTILSLVQVAVLSLGSTSVYVTVGFRGFSQAGLMWMIRCSLILLLALPSGAVEAVIPVQTAATEPNDLTVSEVWSPDDPRAPISRPPLTAPSLTGSEMVEPHTSVYLNPKIAVGCLSYAILALLPVIVFMSSISFVKTGRDDTFLFAFCLILWSIPFVPLSLVFVIVQFIPQIRSTWTIRKPSSMDISTLGLQAILFVLLGVSWSYRLRSQYDSIFSEAFVFPFGWYYTFGWRYFNFILYGLGQGVLFSICIYRKHMRSLATQNMLVSNTAGTPED